MKQVTMIQVGEGSEAKFFLTKEEAQEHEIAVIINDLLLGSDGEEKSASALSIAKIIMSKKDDIVAIILAKNKRKPRTPKAVTATATRTKNVKHQADQPPLV